MNQCFCYSLPAIISNHSTKWYDEWGRPLLKQNIHARTAALVFDDGDGDGDEQRASIEIG